MVKRKRGELRLSQENLATDALGDPARKSEISRIENGKTNPQENTIQKLNTALGITETEMKPIRQSNLTTKDLDNLPALDRDDLELLATRFQIADAPDLKIKQLRNLLHEKAKDYRALRKEVDDLKTVSPRLANQHAAAMDALDNLRIEEAEEILANAREVVTEQLREPLAINAQLMEAQAAAALTRDDVVSAFTLLSAAADSFAGIDPLEPARRRIRNYSVLLRNHSLRFGGAGLTVSLQLLAPAITQDLKAKDAWLWGSGKISQGVALRNQATRTTIEDSTRLLKTAVAAYRDALTVRSRDSHPFEWAVVMNNLAIALQNQGTRTGGVEGTKILAESVAAYRDALKVHSCNEYPVEWAKAQNNLATALRSQGSRTDGAEGMQLLVEAVEAYHEALSVRTQEDRPVEWAMTKNNLAIALHHKGIRSEGAKGTHLLAKSVAAYCAALTVRTQDDHPVDWALTQHNLSLAEEAIANHEHTPSPRPHFEAALSHVEAALNVFDPEHMRFQFEKATRLRDRLKARLAALD